MNKWTKYYKIIYLKPETKKQLEKLKLRFGSSNNAIKYLLSLEEEKNVRNDIKAIGKHKYDNNSASGQHKKKGSNNQDQFEII